MAAQASCTELPNEWVADALKMESPVFCTKTATLLFLRRMPLPPSWASAEETVSTQVAGQRVVPSMRVLASAGRESGSICLRFGWRFALRMRDLEPVRKRQEPGQSKARRARGCRPGRDKAERALHDKPKCWSRSHDKWSGWRLQADFWSKGCAVPFWTTVEG